MVVTTPCGSQLQDRCELTPGAAVRRVVRYGSGTTTQNHEVVNHREAEDGFNNRAVKLLQNGSAEQNQGMCVCVIVFQQMRQFFLRCEIQKNY